MRYPMTRTELTLTAVPLTGVPLAGLPLAGVALAAIVLAGWSLPRPAAAEVKPPTVDLPFETYTLKNGLEVILRKDARVPLVAVNLWYHVGPANEEPGRTGFAHLFEHMMFQNSLHVGEDRYFSLLEAAGASHINGTTDFDRTNYHEDVPSSQLELALWMESDRMGYLLETLDAVSLANQQDVVRNERRQGVENPPYGLQEEELWHALFPKTHPYYAAVIGSHEDVQAAKLEDVRDFFRRYYCPNNASLAIVGDIDLAETKALIDRYFGSIPRGAEVPPIKATTPPITSERRISMTDKVELPRLTMAWITPPIYQPGDAEAKVTARILGQGKASRLYKALVYDQQIAQDVSIDPQSKLLGTVFQLSATAKPGHTNAELEAAIDAEIARLATEGPTEEELASARNGIWSDMISSLERSGGFAGVADRLNQYNHYHGTPDYLNRDLARYAAVTRKGVQEFAAAQLGRNKRALVACDPGEKVLPPDPPAPPMPEATAEKVSPEDPKKEPWRNTIPSAAARAAVALPTPNRFELPNGLTVYHHQSKALPVAAGQIILRAGSAADPAGKFGLAGFTADLLDEGTTKRDAMQLARDLEALGADLGVGSGSDGTFANCRSLKQNFGPTLSILAEVVLSPSFAEAEVERVRSQRITGLIEEQAAPFGAGVRVLGSCLHGETHPYGHTPGGTEETVQAISRADVQAFYRDYYAPNNAALILVGDLSVGEAKKLATDAFGGWIGEAKVPASPDAGRPIANRLVIVDKPGAPQTALLVAQIATRRSDPDWDRLNLLNVVVGGNFAGRLNMNLREDKGYSYGCYSWLGDERGVSSLGCFASVRADVTGASIGEMLNEYRGLLTRPATEEELTLAKRSLTQTLPAKFETTNQTVGTLGQLYLNDQPLDYFQSLPGRVNAMTSQDLVETAKKWIRPERMLVVAVGDRAQIEAQVGELKLGAVAHRAADGKPVDLN
ncbi:MAG: insulinase family protein [Candidatus Eisenbacteria bacterium]|nr:insulinase family protein [Candidatus Eisenbacteria bacterium]